MSDKRCAVQRCTTQFGGPKIKLRDEDLKIFKEPVKAGAFVCVRHYLPSKEQVEAFIATGNLLPGAKLGKKLTKTKCASSPRTSYEHDHTYEVTI